MKRLVVFTVVLMMFACSEVGRHPGPNRVNLVIPGNASIDDLTIMVRPWRVRLDGKYDLTVVLNDAAGIVESWEINNTEPDKTDLGCPAFPRATASAADPITVRTVQQPPPAEVLCRYSIILRPVEGREPIMIDPEYRIGPH